MVGVHFLKRVEWRGVWYEIHKDNTIQLIEYIPYAEVQKNEATSEPTSL